MASVAKEEREFADKLLAFLRPGFHVKRVRACARMKLPGPHN